MYHKVNEVSDGYEGYSDAILSVYGEFDSMTRKLQSLKSPCYGQIIKRIERKSQGFSKKFKYMQRHNSFVANYYNLCIPHSSLAEYEGGKPIQTTPAMATEITDRKWSIQELLTANRNFD